MRYVTPAQEYGYERIANALIHGDEKIDDQHRLITDNSLKLAADIVRKHPKLINDHQRLLRANEALKQEVKRLAAQLKGKQ